MAALLPGTPALAQPRQVTFAGVAYSGEKSSIDARFPFTRKYEDALRASGDSFFKRSLRVVAATPPQNFTLTTEAIDELKGKDQAIVSALVIGSETVSIERFGETRKLFVLLRGQAVFFDFKSMTVIRAFPLSFGYIDNFSRDPTIEEVSERVRLVIEGAGGKPGLISRYASALASASIPNQTPRFLQVSRIGVSSDFLAVLPSYLKDSPTTYETWAADIVGEAISTRIGVPIIPYSKGYAIGNVMSMRVMDGEVYNLTLPKPDYEISVDLKSVRKIKFSDSPGGAAYIYGSYADIRIQEPLSGTTYLDTALKNGETKIVPASQTFVDDFPAFYDSVNGMFVKLAEAVAGKGGEWVKSAAAAPSIAMQIVKTRELMELCK